ncbi:MAG: hypothetical protein II000_07310, partial [Clostridia bacterium]|nr:hypothetical protein [Clostridia bacterium]
MTDRRRRFALRLALQLGYANVDAMMREMTAQQFDEWIAYYQIEPFGILAEDALSAHWKAIYVNAHRKKGKQAMKVDKFMLFREQKKD